MTTTTNICVEGNSPTRNTATKMLLKTYPECNFILPGVIGDGLTLFGGKPKLGKSVFVLNIALSVASGGLYLGRKIKKGVCSYLSLENGERTTARRLQDMLGRFDGVADTDNLLIENEWGDKPIERLDRYLESNPDVTFVIIDTLVKFFSRVGSSYNDAYEQIQELRNISFEHDVPFLVIDHLRKSESRNVIDMFSGSIGKAGATDGLLAMLDSSKYDAELHALGRDIEDVVIPLERVPEFKFWDMKGTTDVKKQQEQLIQAIRAREDKIFTPKEIAESSGLNPSYCRKTLRVWVAKNRIAKVVGHGQYMAL